MKVKFVPQNVEFEIKPGESVMHVAQDHNLYIKSVCKGVPSCAECRVRVVEGEHNVLPPGSEELALIGTGHFIDRRRLSCQLKCFGDITVDLTEQVEKQATGGKKSKKVAVKDDRVEEAVAIRGEGFDEDKKAEGRASGQRQQHQQKQKGPGQQQQQARGQSVGHAERQPSQQQGKQQGKQQKPQAQKQAQQQARPPQAEGAEEVRDGKEGGAKRKRRRRRGGRGGGGGQGPGSGQGTGGPSGEAPAN